jgi:iron complex outermembrane recepter protein
MSRNRVTKPRGRGKSTFIVRATVAALLCLPGGIPAFANDALQQQFTIPAQSLQTALEAFEKQSGIRVVFSPQIATGYVVPVLNGRYTSAAALQVLLQGTGLKAHQIDARTIEVQAAGGQLVRTADVQGQIAADHANLLAQNAAQAQTPNAPPAAAPPADQLQEVTVTGSRIARPDYTALTPIVTVDSASFENRSDVGVGSALEQLPQFHVSGNGSALSLASNPFPSPTAAPGAATVDLRGLGANRTLVLIDGMRAQPTNALLEVDLNTIPAEAIASVETITGGAASTYGADAISGVVNFKLKQNFQGVEIDAQQGISQRNDDKETSVSALMGGNFADNKGNLMVVLDYARRGQVYSDRRGWVQAGWADPYTTGGAVAGGSTANLAGYVTAAGNLPTGAAAFPLSPGAGGEYMLDQNGNLFDAGNPTGPHPYTGPLGGNSGFKVNPLNGVAGAGPLGYNDESHAFLGLPLTRWSALVTGHYDFTDHISAFTEFMFANTKVSAIATPSLIYSFWSLNIPYNPLYDNPSSPTFQNGPAGTSYHPVPQQLATLLDSRPDPTATWQYDGTGAQFGSYSTDTSTTLYQLTTGLRGDIPGTDSTWTVYGTRGESNVNAQLNGFPTLSRLQDLANASNYGKNWTNSAYFISVAGNCTSGLDLFNTTGTVNSSPTISANCRAYADPALNNITTLTQQVFEGDLQGSLLEMPFFNAGKLRYAVGADYRSEDFSFTPDSGYTAYQDFPNIVQNIALPVATQGQTGVSEIYTEFVIPVFKDLPLVKSFEIDPGFRFSHYDSEQASTGTAGSGGNVDTFKVLGNWKIEDWVSVRGGLEVANRAPNVAELFTPLGGSSIGGLTDPCAAYNITQTWGNNPANPNRYNVQAACQYLIERGGAPASTYIPGAGPTPNYANNWQYSVVGPSPAPFPFVLALTSGNPNLKSEEARTVTYGVVLNSPFDNAWTQRAKLSVDWYQIQVNGAIGVPSASTVYQECLDAQYNKLIGSTPGTYTGAQLVGSNPFCAYINREYAPPVDPYGAPRNYTAAYINTGGIQSRGIDTELDWGLKFSDVDLFSRLPGAITLNVVATYLDRYALSPFPGASYINYTGSVATSSSVSAFRYKLFTTFGYTVGPASVGFRWQHLPSLGPDPSTIGTGTQGAASYNEVDMFARWQINDLLELRGGIDNLLDASPVTVGANPDNAALGTTSADYDAIGRRFYLGVKVKL